MESSENQEDLAFAARARLIRYRVLLLNPFATRKRRLLCLEEQLGVKSLAEK
jgi:hypothetical protein